MNLTIYYFFIRYFLKDLVDQVCYFFAVLKELLYKNKGNYYLSINYS
ncbi:hypothetical protein cce_1650 [Crocosphaera subtropica ATCC 51142]|uniref:Uncharacterized protein n=1 Tax=Crocosphaera subtropica (strain ATCC 51142 / BH68) TaxID=43989 RepID=B1WY13_CROS5|nr:hypothetical protein cce_1650 [Crocosphaera subtropica ATCC 51142]